MLVHLLCPFALAISHAELFFFAFRPFISVWHGFGTVGFL